MKNIVRNYIKNEDGLVTIEWVSIAAVVILAAIVIAGFMMSSASDLGNSGADKLDAIGNNVTAATTPSVSDFGRN